jgi:hypothetical protein
LIGDRPQTIGLIGRQRRQAVGKNEGGFTVRIND